MTQTNEVLSVMATWLQRLNDAERICATISPRVRRTIGSRSKHRSSRRSAFNRNCMSLVADNRGNCSDLPKSIR